MIIAGLLLASAALRIGVGAGQAIAQDPEQIEVGTQNASATCPSTEDFEAMLAAFKSREAQIDAREKAIEDRMNALRIADAEVARKLDELAAAEAQLSDTLALADTAAEGDLGKLTKVYETMKPKQAAALFEQMDPNFAAGFLGRMRPEAAAAIMAGLSPEAAHLYSVVLAGRNANVPKE
jgi:flagellar motility protein MotE (MotC chaperone)